MAIVATWQGLGPEDPALESHYGIPARDLSDEDWARLDDAQRATVEQSRLYRVRPRAVAKVEEQLDAPADADKGTARDAPASAAASGPASGASSKK